MDILYRAKRATASEIMASLTGDPAYATVRAQLRALEEKGHIKHEARGLRNVYSPTVPRHAMRESMLKYLVDTFFEGSTRQAIIALLGSGGSRLSGDELDAIEELIDKARKEGRG